MQIFEYDYKTGKGEKLDDVHFSGVGQGLGFVRPGISSVTHKRGMVVHEHLIVFINNNYESKDITADKYGVRAITFCSGQVDGKWEWAVVCNKEDAEKAKERNIKKFGHSHWKFD